MLPATSWLRPLCRYADDTAYEGILFVRLSSDENPVSKRLMAECSAPFFVSYCQGRMLECDTRDADAGMQAQFDRLRSFVPPAA